MLFTNALSYAIAHSKTDADLIQQLIKRYDLSLVFALDTCQLKPQQTKLVKDLQETLQLCFEVSSPTSYAKISWEQLKEAMTNEMDIDLSETSYLKPIQEEHLASSKKLKRALTKELNNSGELSTTPKRNKRDTSTYSTDVSIMDHIVAVPPYEASKSSAEELDTLLSSIQPVTYNSGSIGSSIFYKNQGKSYTWKVPEWTLAQKYIDLKIYNNPNQLQEKKPMDQWREASFRAKVLIGTPASKADRTQKIDSLLNQLIPLLIGEANDQPQCLSQVRESDRT